MTRAVLARTRAADLDIVDVELGDVGADEVRVRIRAAGVCHSDLSMVNGTVSPRFPLVLGHEASGVVTEVGSSVTRAAVGDHVVLNWSPPCRACWFCLRGEPWLCEREAGLASVPRGTLRDGTPVNLTLGMGALADEVVVSAEAVIPVPAELDFSIAALMGCALLTGFGAVTRAAEVQRGDSVAVIGLGGVGLSVVAAARRAGADPIIALDRSPAKERLARTLGATEFLVADTDTHRHVRSLTGRRGVDHAFECVGRAVTIKHAWQSTRRGGNTIVVGMGSASDLVQLSALEIFHFARTLKSSVYGSSDPDVDVPRLAELVLSGELDLTGLISHRVGLDGVADAFERMEQGEGARTVVVFD